MRRRSTPFRTMLLAFVASLVFVFGMVLSTGTVSAHTASTASAQSSASAMDASTRCGGPDCGGRFGFFPGFGINQCGNFGEFQFDQCGIGNGCFGGCFNSCQFSGCGFNNCNSLETFVGGDQFGNCNFFFPSEFHHHRHHRHLVCFRRHHHRVCVLR